MFKKALSSFCLASLLLGSCSQENSSTVASNDLVISYTNRYDHDEEIILYGMENEFDPATKKLTLLYLTYKKIGVVEARELLITTIDGILKKINQDKKNYPWDYSFTYKDIDLGIAFKSGEEQFAPANYVASLCLEDGKVKYSFYDQQEKQLEDLHTESYAAAYKIVLGKELHPSRGAKGRSEE